MLQADGRVILRPEAADISEPEAVSLLPQCMQVETGAFAAGSTQEVLSQAGLERIKKGCPFPGLLESGIIPPHCDDSSCHQNQDSSVFLTLSCCPPVPPVSRTTWEDDWERHVEI